VKNTIQREILIPQSREQVWQALTDSAALAEWMYPNDFEPRVGHNFTFRVPPNPKVGFEGVVIECKVLECQPPSRLTYSWSGGAIVDTRVSYRLEPDGEGTRLIFEHSGFDLSQPWCEPAMRGLEYGYAKIFKQFAAFVARQAVERN
jgi:uncharacterized protein YndB with AHSA1/START domain